MIDDGCDCDSFFSPLSLNFCRRRTLLVSYVLLSLYLYFLSIVVLGPGFILFYLLPLQIPVGYSDPKPIRNGINARSRPCHFDECDCNIV